MIRFTDRAGRAGPKPGHRWTWRSTFVAGGLAGLPSFVLGTQARAQVLGAPPPDAKTVVNTPVPPGDAPKIEQKLDGTTVTLSAGGMISTGNSRQIATTGNGAFETRFLGNSVGASLVGNYGRGAPPNQAQQVTAQNLQGRLRYDRYVVQQATFFLINTGRHDKLQGLAFRYNIDPGFKYLFWQDAEGALWAEGGYDLQYDIRRDDARVVLDANKAPVLDPITGQPQLLDKTATDHSARLFVGFRYAFNKEVTLTTGVEYLQSFVDSDHFRLNFDSVFAAKVTGGLSVGFGFSGRYDHAPLPGKQDFDSSTTLSLIYAFSDVAAPPAPPPPPACPECPNCPAPLPPPAVPSESDPANTSASSGSFASTTCPLLLQTQHSEIRGPAET